jgi:hypothetical protein
MPSKPDSGMVSLSALVSCELRDFLRDVGRGNVSRGLRLAVTTPYLTPSGATLIAHPMQLPTAEDAEGPEIMATPAGIVAHGVGPASLVFDCDEGELVILTGAGPMLSRPLDLQALSAWAISLPPAVLTIGCRPGGSHGPAALPGALRLWRMAPGLIAIGSEEVFVILPVRQALQLAAEVVGLLANRVQLQQVAVCELEQALQADPAEVMP